VSERELNFVFELIYIRMTSFLNKHSKTLGTLIVAFYYNIGYGCQKSLGNPNFGFDLLTSTVQFGSDI